MLVPKTSKPENITEGERLGFLCRGSMDTFLGSLDSQRLTVALRLGTYELVVPSSPTKLNSSRLQRCNHPQERKKDLLFVICTPYDRIRRLEVCWSSNSEVAARS